MKTRIVVLLSLVFVLSWSTRASAKTDVAEEDTNLRHCISQVVAGTDEDEDVDLGPDEAQSNLAYLPIVVNSNTVGAASNENCYATFSDAIYAATAGAVVLASDATADSFDEEALNAASASGAAAQTVIGIMYANSSYGGSSFTWYTNNSVGCNTGLNYYQATPPSGWDNVVSSARSYGGCARWYHYENTYYGGAALRVITNNSNFGAMNDRASSWRWWKTGYHY